MRRATASQSARLTDPTYKHRRGAGIRHAILHDSVTAEITELTSTNDVPSHFPKALGGATFAAFKLRSVPSEGRGPELAFENIASLSKLAAKSSRD